MKNFAFHKYGKFIITNVLVDKKILAGGLAMIIVGIALSAILGEATPIGQGGMTAEEQLEFLMEEQQNTDYKTLAGILIGVGFLLILISFGARRKKKGGVKRTEKSQLVKLLNNVKMRVTLFRFSPNFFY